MENFLTAIATARQPDAPEITVAWLVGVARRKLANHWRRSVREERSQAVAASRATGTAAGQPSPVHSALCFQSSSASSRVATRLGSRTWHLS